MRSYFKVLPLSAIVSGCAFPHPLQDDVTQLPLASIIRKITCESRDALDEALNRRQVADEREAYRRRNLKFRNLKKNLSLSKAASELNSTKTNLDFALAVVDAEQKAIVAKLSLAKSDEELPESLKTRIKRVKERRSMLLEKVVTHSNDVWRHNNDVEQANERLSQEANAIGASNDELSRYYDHSIAYSFRFRIVATNSMGADASWKLPLIYNGLPGTWSIGGKIGDTKVRNSDRNVKLVMSFEDLHGLDCADAAPDANVVKQLYYPITGTIGVSEVIEQYFRILDVSRSDQEIAHAELGEKLSKAKAVFGETDSYTDSILFSTTISGSLMPSLNLTPTLRESFAGSIDAGAIREDHHSVLISLSSSSSSTSDTKDVVQKVVIVPTDPFRAN